MNKFQKRITKSMRKNLQDAIVIGHGFGMLEEILETFNTVFILNGPDDIKRRNLVNRASVESLYGLYTVGAMFIDLDQVNLLSKDLESVLTNPAPDLFIEGNDVIPRTHTKIIYRLGYLAVNQLGWCHQWSVKR